MLELLLLQLRLLFALFPFLFLICRWPDPELLLEDDEESTWPPSDEDDRESVEIDELDGEISGLLSPLLLVSRLVCRSG